MTKTLNKIRIKAGTEKVYEALASADGLKAWFTPEIDGEIASGKSALFHHKGRDDFRWKFIDLKPGSKVEWECLEGPGDAAGTHVTFDLSTDGQTTVVQCEHDGWKTDSGAFDSCNTLWGILLGRLKSHVETDAKHPTVD